MDSSNHALSSALNALDMIWIENPQLPSAWRPLGTASPAEERRQWWLINRTAVRVLEAAFHTCQSGSLTDYQWGRFKRSVCSVWGGLDSDWQQRFEFNMTEDLVSYLGSGY